MRKAAWVFVAIVAIGFSANASLAHAAVIPACQVENPPANCESMWAAIAHVRLPKQPITAVNPPPRCQPEFESVNWGKIVADALKAEANPETLQNLAMDASVASLGSDRGRTMEPSRKSSFCFMLSSVRSAIMARVQTLTREGFHGNICSALQLHGSRNSRR